MDETDPTALQPFRGGQSCLHDALMVSRDALLQFVAGYTEKRPYSREDLAKLAGDLGISFVLFYDGREVDRVGCALSAIALHVTPGHVVEASPLPMESLYPLMAMDILEGLCEKHLLTEDGCAWLKMALDPFHDYALKVEGMPDTSVGPSCVLHIQKSVTISKPAALAAGNWDCHVAWTGLECCESADVSQCLFSQVGTQPVGHGTARVNTTKIGGGLFLDALSGVSINSVAGGTNTFDATVATQVYQSLNYYNDVVPNQNDHRNFRLIGAGFEVENTTAELNKQGAVTCYRTPLYMDQKSVSSTNTLTTILRQMGADTKILRTPPNTLAQAKQTGNSKTWMAAEGCYVPIVLQGPNPPTPLAPSHVILESTGTGNCSYADTALADSYTVGTTDMSLTNWVPLTHFSNHQTCGAYFTGLSDSTTLTVALNAWVEVFPNGGDVLLPLSSPSPQYDKTALDLYSETVVMLPPGVMRKDNDVGRFFRSALDAVRRAVPKVLPLVNTALSALPIPHGKAVAAGISTVAKATGLDKAPKKKAKESSNNFGDPLKKVSQAK